MADLSMITGGTGETILRDNNLFTDTTGNLGYTENANYYLPILYGKKVLYKFYEDSIFKELCNTDYESLFKSGGTSVKIRMAPEISTNLTYAKGEALTYEVPSLDALYMDIDKAYTQSFAVEDVDKVQADIDLFNMYVESGKKSMAKALDQAVLTIIRSGAKATENAGTAAGVLSTNINLGTDTTTAYIGIDRTNALDKIVELCQVLQEQNINDDVNIVIPSWYETRLKLSDLKAADFTGDSTGVVRNGLLGQINGAKIYSSNNLVKGSNAWPVVACTKMASSFAAQLSKAESLRIPSTFGEYYRVLYVWGAKVIRPEGVATMFAMPA